MKKIEMWRADDGEVFENRAECEKHEKMRIMVRDYENEHEYPHTLTLENVFSWVLDRYDVQFPPRD